MDWFYLAIAAAVLLSAALVIQKKMLLAEHALQNSVVIGLVQVVFSLALLPRADFSGFDGGAVVLTLVATVLAGLGVIFSARALRHLEISLAAPVYAVGTVLVVLLAAAFLGERLAFGQYFGIGLVLFGAYFVDLQKGKSLLAPLKDLVSQRYLELDFLSVMLYSLSYFFTKPVLDRVDPIAFLVVQNTLIAAGLYLYAGIKFNVTKDVVAAWRKDYKLHITIGVFFIAQNVLMLLAVNAADVSLVIPVYRMWILGVVIFGGRLFHEHNFFYRLIGALVMVGGAALVANPSLLPSL